MSDIRVGYTNKYAEMYGQTFTKPKKRKVKKVSRADVYEGDTRKGKNGKK